VQCHMVPTGVEFDGTPGTGANHLFKVVTPAYAASHTLTVSGRTGPMTNSACGQCHGTKTDPLALYMQPVLDSRQALFDQRSANLSASLDKAAIGLGYKDAESAGLDIGEPSDPNSTNPNVLAFLKAETNWELVTQDGSRGIHNWAYTQKIFDEANEQVSKADPIPFTVTLKSSKSAVSAGAKVTLRGTVSTPSQSNGMKVTIQKKKGADWATVATVKATGGKANSAFSLSWKVPKGKSTLRAKFGPHTYKGVTRPVSFSKTVAVTGK
jgi:hypothetical protein